MIGELECNIKDFDVTQPFIIHRNPTKKSMALNNLTYKIVKQPDKNELLKKTQTSSQVFKDEQKKNNFEGMTLEEINKKNEDFYLAYLEYFVNLTIKFNRINSKSGEKVTEEERANCQLLKRRILYVVTDLMKKYVI